MVQHYWGITIFCCTHTHTFTQADRHTHTQLKVTMYDTQCRLDFTQIYTVLWAKPQFSRMFLFCFALELSCEHLFSIVKWSLSFIFNFCHIFLQVYITFIHITTTEFYLNQHLTLFQATAIECLYLLWYSVIITESCNVNLVRNCSTLYIIM